MSAPDPNQLLDPDAISRAESQRKSVQIIGASPIIRALLLLIGISPRHFIKKAM